jgi:ubiquinone/menaquinone biosynthesis C-methylase UbiE
MAHTHDGIDWTSRLEAFRRADEVAAPARREVAERLVGLLPDGATVADIGSGAGGMSAALASALSAKGGGRVILVDAVPELLSAAESRVREELTTAVDPVELRTVRVDAASEELPDLVPNADLVWASRVLHHLPDQQRGLAGLVRVLAPGGWLALVEGGLATQCLPWDIGVGEPGLVDRLTSAQNAWFADMRATMPGVTRLTVGWSRAMADAGLADVSSFSYLIDRPAPATELTRQSAVDWLSWIGGVAAERLDASDQVAVSRLLDPDDPAYVGKRDDVFVLSASTVHMGRKISA